MIVKMKISPAALVWLGRLVPPQTRISPLSMVGSVPVTEEDREHLVGAGILDDSFEVAQPFREAVDLLARASSYCRIRLTTGSIQVEKSVYFHEDRCISLDPTPEGLVIRYPGTSDVLLEYLQYFTGNSPITHSEFSMEGSPAEALVLSALVDLTRFNQMVSYARDQMPEADLDPEEILAAVNLKTRTSKRLVSFVRNVANVHSMIAQGVVEECLEALAAQNLVARQANCWGLAGEAERMASNFWVIDDVVHMQGCVENQEKQLAFSQWMCVQSGLHDRLYMDINDGKVRMAVISAANLLEYMDHALSVPPAIF